MTRAHPSTPLWVKLAIAGLLATALAWWIGDRLDRRGNERRLGAIASRIAGQRAGVHRPDRPWPAGATAARP